MRTRRTLSCSRQPPPRVTTEHRVYVPLAASSRARAARRGAAGSGKSRRGGGGRMVRDGRERAWGRRCAAKPKRMPGVADSTYRRAVFATESRQSRRGSRGGHVFAGPVAF